MPASIWRKALLNFPWSSFGRRGAIAENPINHQCGPSLGLNGSPGGQKSGRLCLDPTNHQILPQPAAEILVRARRKKPELQRKLRLFVKFGLLAVSCTLSGYPHCLVDFVRAVENRKLVAPRAICQKWRLEWKFLGGYSQSLNWIVASFRGSKNLSKMGEDEDSLEFVPCCKLHVLFWLVVDT